MRSKYKDIITATSVKKFRKSNHVEGFTVIQLRIDRFNLFELHAAVYNHKVLGTSNFITKLPYIKWQKDLTTTQKIFAKAEELFAESSEIVCGFKEKDILGFATAYRQFRGTYINESHVCYDEIFEGKNIKELLIGDRKPKDIIDKEFSVTVDIAEQLAAVIMDYNCNYYTDVCTDDSIRACMFLLEQTERLGYNAVEVLDAALYFHEMEIGERELAPVYLRKAKLVVM